MKVIFNGDSFFPYNGTLKNNKLDVSLTFQSIVLKITGDFTDENTFVGIQETTGFDTCSFT